MSDRVSADTLDVCTKHMSEATAVNIDYPAFDHPVPDHGYRWWYLDAISDDGQQMITIIAFVGSVFSPYYRRARKRQPQSADPQNYCAINVALYAEGKNRWCMTERYHEAVQRDQNGFVIGPSSLKFEQINQQHGKLTIDINERAAPIPRRVIGRVEIDLNTRQQSSFTLDSINRHHWWPVSPGSQVNVDLKYPSQRWKGHAYVDMNWGSAPIEDDIDYWCWSRYRLANETIIFYDVYGENHHPPAPPDQAIAVSITDDGQIKPVADAEMFALARTGWRMPRHARSHKIHPVVEKTLEDTPFYSRSMLTTHLNGKAINGIHESVSLRRFKKPIVQAMLHFRMPRIRWSGKTSFHTPHP